MKSHHFQVQNDQFAKMILFRKNHKCNFYVSLGPFIYAKFQKTFRMDPEIWRCAIFGPKWPICPKWNFFLEKHYYKFHVPLGSFHCAKFQKNRNHFPQMRFFSERPLANIISMYLLASFIVQNFKNIL